MACWSGSTSYGAVWPLGVTVLFHPMLAITISLACAVAVVVAVDAAVPVPLAVIIVLSSGVVVAPRISTTVIASDALPRTVTVTEVTLFALVMYQISWIACPPLWMSVAFAQVFNPNEVGDPGDVGQGAAAILDGDHQGIAVVAVPVVAASVVAAVVAALPNDFMTPSGFAAETLAGSSAPAAACGVER